ncbi:hypothetical protein CEXT_118001 [Caerostris extrusa]|uniref:Uncharacterized protein n=1 Tax=Caerostris extrusa TaxID=172846 RepID=A0AAV4XV75_CAEEX|nr:hypothetical protein CEXT_118001 [Caerostris extrusa]
MIVAAIATPTQKTRISPALEYPYSGAGRTTVFFALIEGPDWILIFMENHKTILARMLFITEKTNEIPPTRNMPIRCAHQGSSRGEYPE